MSQTTTGPLLLDLLIPDTRVLGVDSVWIATQGKGLEDFLGPFLRGNVARVQEGDRTMRWPLTIPDGAGIALPLPPFGLFGLRYGGIRGNGLRMLSITFPMAMRSSLEPLFTSSGYMVGEPGNLDHGGQTLRQLWMGCRAGASMEVPMKLGTIGVHVL